MSLLARVVVVLVSVVWAAVTVQGSAAHASLARGDTADSDPDATWGWEQVFFDGFDGPPGAQSEQWHTMPGHGPAAQNGVGQLDVGPLAQIRSTAGWTLPVGTQVRVTASLVMPDTGSGYAAFWVQHPDGADPREIDVIESYGPLKPAGAQVGSHICYDDTPETAANACAATGRGPELWPVTQAFPPGAEPWSVYWEYAADFAIGGEGVLFSARDGQGGTTYEVASTPDARRVPGNSVPFHLRLSNKAVLPEHVVAGGSRPSMLVDWVSVTVKYP
ncbi:hypothetical protein GCM10011376_03120 [Nocardioides flavus (ex Wang et al. 2016)]|uniref:GH16 domain-containing protein n=2 Tax=Nocardioides flavus (ex Wang et al. 2016) TaxID=2058780 RepID=A0ABQ3HDP9_9ACTN|nr:hypothetical protein GCM10011376_03120 [Nocardioides flavus (ex Wang et al. 2016)]